LITHLHTALDLARWLQAIGAKGVTADSRLLQPGHAFLAWPGAAQDSRRYVRSALEQGAVACVVEQDGADAYGFDDDRVAAVAGLKALSGEIASLFHHEPSRELDVVAITGTNGKTSTAWWTALWLQALGTPATMVGTLGMGRPGQPLDATGLTTPDPARLQAGLRAYVDSGVKVCVMEVSSIGLDEARLAGTTVHTAVFTNFTQDHLDYHGTMAAYWAAKRRLFDWPGLRVAVVNVDDDKGAALAFELAERTQGSHPIDLWTVSVQGAPARLTVPEWTLTDSGLRFTVVEAGAPGNGGAGWQIKLPLVGDYNLYNLLCALAVLRARGVSMADAVGAASALLAVPGRMQPVWPEAPEHSGPLVLVDYAHTPDALEKALRALQPLALARGGRLWCLVGCGGDRDPSKRPLMAAVAEREAAVCVFTSDNPRREDPMAILAQMQAGLAEPGTVAVVPDRTQAVQQAVDRAGVRDVVLLAGKGHEPYQEVAGVRHPYSDVDHARQVLQARWVREKEGA